MPESNQDKSQPDDPRHAAESGDVQATGRSRGHVVDHNDPNGPARTAPDNPADEGSDKANEKSEHWESGRQRSS